MRCGVRFAYRRCPSVLDLATSFAERDLYHPNGASRTQKTSSSGARTYSQCFRSSDPTLPYVSSRGSQGRYASDGTALWRRRVYHLVDGRFVGYFVYSTASTIPAHTQSVHLVVEGGNGGMFAYVNTAKNCHLSPYSEWMQL